jgi:hypothetical protein
MVFVISNFKVAWYFPYPFSLPPQASGVVAPKKSFLSAAKWKGSPQKLPEI